MNWVLKDGVLYEVTANVPWGHISIPLPYRVVRAKLDGSFSAAELREIADKLDEIAASTKR